MATLAPFIMVDVGTKPTFVAASATDIAPIGSGSDTFLQYRNTDTNAKTVTVSVLGNTAYGQPKPAPALTLAATTGELWIPLRKDFDQGSANPGYASVTITGTGGVTGVTVAVVRHS